VKLLEKLSPALEQVDSSSGAIGSAVNRAIDALVPIIAKAEVDRRARQGWLERLWAAVEDDGIPYIEDLADAWGDLCVTTDLASAWADEFLPLAKRIWSPQAPGHGYYKGTTPCLAALYKAGRHDEVLALLATAPYIMWHDRRWGVRALVALGRQPEALAYAEASRGRNDPGWQIAQACEEILLSSGMWEEAYLRYALEANRGGTNLTTLRAIAKKYPHKPREEILLDLIASTPGEEGKWFAAVKDAGLFELATELAMESPTDPRTLTRAARDCAAERPNFAIASGMAALRWISRGYGYEITGADVLDAYTAVLQAARGAGLDERNFRSEIATMIAGPEPGNHFLTTVLGRRVAG
jgi:hypothetical protein